MSVSLVRAFPARLASVVTDVGKSLPEAPWQPAGSVTVTESQSRTWPGLVVNGEPVLIPRRIYNPEPSPRYIAGLNPVEGLVAAGIYSRHHDGYVRQRWLGTLLDAGEPWAAPFIVQLLGEYVIEICRDIERFAASSFSPMHQHLSAFLNENRCFAALTRQRAISYWSCYYRYWHPSQDTYPALVALSELSRPAGRLISSAF
ncbi:MAG TPA: hypothetical protein VF223_11715 [Trebonia sp.]